MDESSRAMMDVNISRIDKEADPEATMGRRGPIG